MSWFIILHHDIWRWMMNLHLYLYLIHYDAYYPSCLYHLTMCYKYFRCLGFASYLYTHLLGAYISCLIHNVSCLFITQHFPCLRDMMKLYDAKMNETMVILGVSNQGTHTRMLYGIPRVDRPRSNQQSPLFVNVHVCWGVRSSLSSSNQCKAECQEPTGVVF